MTDPSSASSATRPFYGYYIAAACCLIQAVNLGGVFTFGVLFPELEKEFGWSRTAISGAASFAFFFMGGGAIVMGNATDWFGPRRVLGVAGTLFGLGFVLLYILQSTWELYVYCGLLIGIGLAAHDVGTLSTIARWFVRRRGIMTGIAKAGAGIGQVIAPISAAALIAAYGWRITCLIFGITAICTLIAAALVLHRQPSSLGQLPDGDQPTNTDGGQSFDEKNGNAPQAPSQETGATFKEAIRSKTLWTLCLAKFCDLFCLFTVIVHIIPYAIDRGLSPTLAAAVLSTIGGMSILGRLVVGAAYDRLGARWSLIITFSCLALSLMILQVANSAWLLFLFAAFYGPAHGGFFTITSPSVAEYFGTRTHGTLFGMVISFGTFGATLGPLVAGSLYDGTGSYSTAFLVLLAASLLGLVVAAFLPRRQVLR